METGRRADTITASHPAHPKLPGAFSRVFCANGTQYYLIDGCFHESTRSINPPFGIAGTRQRASAAKSRSAIFSSIPNNYRFIDQPDYVPVQDDAVLDPDVQRRTNRFLIGKNSEEVRDLIASFKKNGWLAVDQIQVREITRGKYVVVEGNRRIATLKHLERRHQDTAIDLGNLDPKIFDAVPVVLYEAADEAHHKVIMGLGHITGKRRWPAVNQARLLRSLLADHGWSEDEVCNAIGVSKRELRSTLKTLTLCDLYRASDYGDQFYLGQVQRSFEKLFGVERLAVGLAGTMLQIVLRTQRMLTDCFHGFLAMNHHFPQMTPSHRRHPTRLLIPVLKFASLAKIVNDENALRTPRRDKTTDGRNLL